MNRPSAFLLLVALLTAPVAAGAQSDPLGLLPTIRSAVRDAVTGAAGAPQASASATAPGVSRGGSSCGNSRIPFLPSFGPVPPGYGPAVLWPDDGQCVNSFRELKFSAAAQQKKAFDIAARVPCAACEGGYSYDSWANHFTEKSGSKPAFEAKLTALPVGKSIRWTGRKYGGEVRATGAHPIGSTACKQYHWTLSAAGKVVAERDGLYCDIGGRWMEMV
jgi:hypothetical protein